MFERFTDRARRVLTLAQEEARLLSHSFIGTEHILLGVIRESDGLGAEALRSLGVSYDLVRDKVEEIVGMSGTTSNGLPPFTPQAKKVLELSLREALQLNHSYIGTEHLLLGLVREGEGVAATVLVGLGVDLQRVRQAVGNLMTGGPEVPRGRDVEEPHSATTHGAPPKVPQCPRCSASLTKAARFRTMSVRATDGNADSIPMHVVYCVFCGSALHMFQSPGPG